MLNEKQKYLKKMFADSLKKNKDYEYKYGPFNEVVYCYIDAILDMFPNVSEQTIKNILNVEMNFKEGFDVNFTKRGLYHENRYDVNDLSKMSQIINIYTSKEEYNDDIEIVGNKYVKKEVPIEYEKLINTPIKDGISLEDKTEQVKIQLRRLESIVHELNHAACFKKTYYLIGTQLIEDKDIKELNNQKIDKLEVYHISGGTTYSFENIDKDKHRKIFVDNASQLLHEGITEYLMKKIFASKAFDSLNICGMPKSFIKYEAYPSYRYLVDVVGMSEVLYDNLLSNSYFAPDLSVEDIEKISKISQSILPITHTLRNIQDMKGNLKQIEGELFEKFGELKQWISIFAYQEKQKYLDVCDKLSDAQKQKFLFYYNDFLDAQTWACEIWPRSVNANKETVMEYIADFMEGISLLRNNDVLKVEDKANNKNQDMYM